MGGIADLPVGLITAPGGVPADAPKTGVEMALERREFPTVPVLRSQAQSLLSQAMSLAGGTRVLAAGDVFVDDARFGLRLDESDPFADESFDAFNAFRDRWASSDITTVPRYGCRVEMLGPTSIALTLGDAGLPRPEAMDAGRLIAAYLASHMLSAIRSVDEERTIAVVMVEPRLVGSMHPTFPLTAREVRSMTDPVVDAVDAHSGAAPVLIGTHVPGRGDWQTLITSGISMLSVPPDTGLVACADWVQAFLSGGGWISWGAIPVDRPIGASEELLWRHLAGTWSDLVAAGVDPALLGRRCMLSTSDGLERFAPEQMPGLLDLLEAMSERVRSEAMAARLRLGS